MFLAVVITLVIIVILTVKIITDRQYKKLETEVFRKLGFVGWNIISYFDEYVTVKSRQTLEKYDDIKFFKENKEKLVQADNIIERKIAIATKLRIFLENNEYKSRPQYHRLTKQINVVLKNAEAYRIKVSIIGRK